MIFILLIILNIFSFSFKNVKYIKNYDGDTVTFNIKNTHPLLGDNISVRLYGIDTPELRTKNACEKLMAQKAKSFIKEKLENAKTIELYNCIRGKYFRLVCEITIDSKINLSNELIKNGLAVEYFGKTKPIVNWCISKK